jgi:hypothetical protein
MSAVIDEAVDDSIHATAGIGIRARRRWKPLFSRCRTPPPTDARV